jgi:hypothetical protein
MMKVPSTAYAGLGKRWLWWKEECLEDVEDVACDEQKSLMTFASPKRMQSAAEA